jgi:hypothetical protein
VLVTASGVGRVGLICASGFPLHDFAKPKSSARGDRRIMTTINPDESPEPLISRRICRWRQTCQVYTKRSFRIANKSVRWCDSPRKSGKSRAGVILTDQPVNIFRIQWRKNAKRAQQQRRRFFIFHPRGQSPAECSAATLRLYGWPHTE